MPIKPPEISLRDYFAGLFMASNLDMNSGSVGNTEHLKRMAKQCYLMADVMIAESHSISANQKKGEGFEG